MALLAVMKRLGKSDFTVHGFRSSFRNWVAEQTAYPREVAEAALAHINGDRVEAAYLRSDHFEKRRQLMAAWAIHCSAPYVESATVLPMRRV
jgi:integrase